jgi:hypothetical protein
MFADPSKLVRALEGAKQRVMAFAQFTAKIGAGAAAAGGAVFAPLAKSLTAAVEEGSEVSQLATQFGSTAEQVSRLRGAFAQAGVGGEDFSSAMERLGEKISTAADSGGFLLDNLQSLGTARDYMGKGLDEQLDMIAERIRAIPNAFDQARAAKDLGFSAEMAAVLKKGKAGLDEYRAAAEKNGDVMSGEQAKQAMEIQREYNRVMLAARSTILEVGKALLPTGASFTSIGQSIRDVLGDVRKWIQSHREIIVGVAAAAGALLAGGSAVAAFGAAVAVAAPIIGGLIIAVKTAIVVVGALVSPIGLAVAAVVAAAVGIGYLISRTEAGQQAFAALKAAIGDAAEFIRGSWRGIADAIGAGDFSLAFNIGMKSLEVVWRGFILKLTTTWIGFKALFVDTWEEATGEIAKAFVLVGAGIESVITGIITALVNQFNAIAKALRLPEISLRGLRSPEEIGRAANAMIDAIDAQTAAEKKRRAEFRRGQFDDAKTALDIAKEQLEILKKQAEESKRQADWDRIPWLEYEEDSTPRKSPLPSFTALSELAKGTFGGQAVQQTLGYGDNVGQRQLDAQIGIENNTAQSVKLLQDLNAKPGAVFK